MEKTSADMPKSAGVLRREMDVFNANISHCTDKFGSFVLITGQEVPGFYPTREEALQEGDKRGGLKPFLVKEIFIPGTEPVANFTRSVVG